MFSRFCLDTLTIFQLPSASLSLILSAIILFLAVCYLHFHSHDVYLVDFMCYQPPDHLRAPIANYIEHAELVDFYDQDTRGFLVRLLKRSGIGDEACVPITVHQIPIDFSLNPTRQETEQVLFSVVKDLLTKLDVNPKSIDIIVSNCSLFCPTPSITAMIINKFGFRSNVKSVSLSGMGCSAGLLSISLAKDLLKVHKNSVALVLSMEAVTPNGYTGKVKSMLLANTLFRMGGAAILLSNRRQDRSRAKYQLQHIVRTHMGHDDLAYRSVFQEPDEFGNVGVSLSKALVRVAGNGLRRNLTDLGPLVLPYSEQIRYVLSMICQRYFTFAKANELLVPNFNKAFEHFCIHAGGRAVIDAVEKYLGLGKDDSEASKMTLYRFGNTSSSSVWYELSYLEAKGRMKKGDRLWQIAFGSGFKCNSAVWKCISNLDQRVKNAWSDRIHRYPVEIPNIS